MRLSEILAQIEQCLIESGVALDMGDIESCEALQHRIRELVALIK